MHYYEGMGKYSERLPAAVAQQLKAERAAAGITIKALAQSTGLHEQTVMRYLNGKRDIPLTELGLLAEALGLSPYEILRRASDRIN